MSMLEQILDFIHNYFEREIKYGRFEISSNALQVDFLQEDQYYKIEGSVFNDGVYQFGKDELKDEVFEGCVKAMGVPKALLDLAEEVADWVAKYGDNANSPYQSESFGGYSYSKKTQFASDSGNKSKGSWQDVFATRLNAYRKIA